jgi:hypothetical protein
VIRKELDTCSRVVPSVFTQAKLEATHDSIRAAGQANDVVPDGAHAICGNRLRIQSLKTPSLAPAKERDLSHAVSTNSLVDPREVLQMLRLGMHDVEMGRPGRENGLLRVGRQSTAKLVF